MNRLRIGISTCPNDTYAFHALMEGMVRIPGLELEFVLLDIEQLNLALINNEIQVGKASFHLALRLSQKYRILGAGAALGFGVGPLLLASQSDEKPVPNSRSNQVTLCPGKNTTASLLFEMFYPHSTVLEQVVFSEIMPRLQNRSADFGVCIHEGRFTWNEQRLKLVEDLGTRWESETKLPLPLGGIIASRQLDWFTTQSINAAIRQSIEMANRNPTMTISTMRRYAQEFDDRVLMQHVDLYVNDQTLSLGELGAAALNEMARRARSIGSISQIPIDIVE